MTSLFVADALDSQPFPCQGMQLLRHLSSPSRFHDVAFLEKDGCDLLLVACEDGKVRIYKDMSEGIEATHQEHVSELAGFKNRCVQVTQDHCTGIDSSLRRPDRVKSLAIVEVLGQHLCTAISSDGSIKTFSLSDINVQASSRDPQVLEAVSSYDTKGSRLTCMTAVAVKDDRATTYAESLPSDNDSGTDDTDDEDISDRETAEAEEEAEAILARLDTAGGAEQALIEAALADSQEGSSEDDEESHVEDDEEWGGIEA